MRNDRKYHYPQKQAVRNQNRKFEQVSARAQKRICSCESTIAKRNEIGANIAEAECSISRNEFLAKMYIAFKECAETEYWLELLYETDYLDAGMYQDIRDDCM